MVDRFPRGDQNYDIVIIVAGIDPKCNRPPQAKLAGFTIRRAASRKNGRDLRTVLSTARQDANMAVPGHGTGVVERRDQLDLGLSPCGKALIEPRHR
jgi:hypothetical protein